MRCGLRWALRDSNPRPQPGESLQAPFGDLGLPRKAQLRLQMMLRLVTLNTRCFPLDRARSAHAGGMVWWYHDTMTKNLTVRLPDDVAADAEALARVEGTSLNETVKQSLIEAVERRRNNPKFKERLAKIIEEDRELLERLAR